MTTPPKRQYRRDIKRAAVLLVEQGASIQAVARQLQIPEKLLQAWVAANTSNSPKKSTW